MDIWEYLKQSLAGYQPGTATGLPVPTPDAARTMASGVVGYGQHVAQGLLDTANTPRDAMSGAMDPTSPEGTDRIIGMAASMPAAGMRFAEPGALGAAGGAATSAALDMSPRARAARAKDMGFSSDTYYHGSPNSGFDQFVPGSGDNPQPGVYFAKNPNIANMYAEGEGKAGADPSPGVYPVKLRMNNPQTIDFKTTDDPFITSKMEDGRIPYTDHMTEVVDRAKSLGHDSLVLKNYRDTVGDMYGNQTRHQTQAIVFDPSQIRSKYAAFDPARRDSADLSAAGGIGAPPVANKYDSPDFSIPATASAPTPTSKNKYDSPDFSVAPAADPNAVPQGALGYINTAARAAANSATFGGADKLANLIHKLAGTPGDEEVNTEKSRREHPYVAIGGEIAGGMLPGAGISNLAGRALPALARPTIMSMMGNGAVTGATMAGANDAAHGETDPTKYAADAAVQGVGGGLLGGLVGGVTGATPMGKFRAAGADMQPEAVQAAADFARRSGQSGVPLTATEAVRAVAPEQVGPLEAFNNSAVRSPKGSAANASFEAGRLPIIEMAAQHAAGSVGPEISPTAAQTAASGAISNARDLINNSAEPYYRAAMNTPMAPHTTDIPSIGHVAARDLLTDPIRLGDLARTTGKAVEGRGEGAATQDTIRRDISALLPRPEPPPPVPGGPVNDNLPQPPAEIPLAVHDKLKHVLGTLYTRAADDKPDVARVVAQARDNLVNQMSDASPQYATATGIENAGRTMSLDHVQNGPLGTIAASNNPAAQSRALFGAQTPMDADAAIRAASRMSGLAARDGAPDPSLGLLSGHLQRAASAGPTGFADALPTPASMRVAQSVGGDALAPVADTVSALRALRPNNAPATDEIHGYGPAGVAWRMMKDLGKGRQVETITDPSNIPLLGQRGRGTTNSLAALISAMNDTERQRGAR